MQSPVILPSVFLSLSGQDSHFVEAVYRHLPDGAAHFFKATFANGEELISAMERRLDGTSIFVLFASKQSASSGPVRFEIDRMRLKQVSGRSVRLLVFPIDHEVSYVDMPPWIQEHWMGRSDFSPRRIAGYITSIVDVMFASNLRSHQVLGRGEELDAMRVEHEDARILTGQKPNVLVFAGNDGIGRRTLSKEFLAKTYPALSDISRGPEFELPQYADLLDLYRALRQELDAEFSLIGFQADQAQFLALDLAAQTEEVAVCLDRFGSFGQAVTVVTGNGIFEDKGLVKPWASGLFRTLGARRDVKLCIITNRMLHENESRPLTNLLQFHVLALKDPHVRSIIIAMADDLGRQPQLPSPAIISSIGGHPQIAKATARLILRQGAAVLDDDPRELHMLQAEILTRSLDFKNLEDPERDVLSLLSWVPHLPAALMRDCLVTRRGLAPTEYAQTLASLQRGCLVEASGPNYQISPPMRMLFRRQNGMGADELRLAFAASLQAEWEAAKAEDRVPTELVDALLFMAALEGGSIPPEFAKLMLPSTLHELVKGVYDNRHLGSERSALEQVVKWGSVATEMKLDETTREEILALVSKSQSRLLDRQGAETTLRYMDQHAYRSRHYLRAFHIRKTGGDLESAVKHLAIARTVRKYINAVLVDLALCYHALGDFKKLRELFQEEEPRLSGNAAMLDIQAALAIGHGDFLGAERIIEKMRLNNDDGRADAREAIVLAHRDQNYSAAQRLLTEVLHRGTRGVLPTRRLRGGLAADAGDFPTAQTDANWVRAQPGGGNDASRIEAKILAKKGDYGTALDQLDRVAPTTRRDEILRARIMEAQASDVSTPLAHRQSLRDRAAVLRHRNKGLSEYDLA